MTPPILPDFVLWHHSNEQKMTAKPELMKISDSEFRCSSCSTFRLELYPDFVSKTQKQWEQFIQGQFAAHILSHHS